MFGRRRSVPCAGVHLVLWIFLAGSLPSLRAQDVILLSDTSVLQGNTLRVRIRTRSGDLNSLRVQFLEREIPVFPNDNGEGVAFVPVPVIYHHP